MLRWAERFPTSRGGRQRTCRWATRPARCRRRRSPSRRRRSHRSTPAARTVRDGGRPHRVGRRGRSLPRWRSPGHRTTNHRACILRGLRVRSLPVDAARPSDWAILTQRSRAESLNEWVKRRWPDTRGPAVGRDRQRRRLIFAAIGLNGAVASVDRGTRRPRPGSKVRFRGPVRVRRRRRGWSGRGVRRCRVRSGLVGGSA